MKPTNTPRPILADSEQLAAVDRLETALRLQSMTEAKGFANAPSPADAPHVERHFDLRTERVASEPARFDAILPCFGVDIVRDDVCPAARTLRPLSVAEILTKWIVGLHLFRRSPA
jgi:hypothetical protein